MLRVGVNTRCQPLSLPRYACGSRTIRRKKTPNTKSVWGLGFQAVTDEACLVDGAVHFGGVRQGLDEVAQLIVVVGQLIGQVQAGPRSPLSQFGNQVVQGEQGDDDTSGNRGQLTAIAVRI